MALQTGIFSELISEQRDLLAAEQRSSLENPLSYPAEWLLDIFNGGRTDSGIRVSELTAFQVVTFLVCVDLIAGKIASLPSHIYERSFTATGRAIHRVAYEHEYYELVHCEPNEEMSWQTFLKAYLCHCLAWGNGFSEIQRDAANGALAFWPRNPAKTRPIRLTAPVRLEPEPWRPFPVNLPAGKLVYSTTDGIEEPDNSEAGGRSARNARIIPAEDMIHVPGLALDGRIGQSVVWLARQALGLMLATEKFGAKYFANFAKPGGILEMPAHIKPEDKETSKRSWQEAQGGENSHRVAVMPPGFKFTPMSHNAQEAQTIETQMFLRTQIASLLHVPARMAGDTSTKTRGSTEQENQELLDFALSPWMSAIKQEFKRKLFPHANIGRRPKNPFFHDFDASELVRGDAASREKFYASGKQWGYLNTNTILGMEKLNPVQEEWAEAYWMPVNMTLVTTPIDPTHQDGAANGSVPEGEPVARAYSRLFRDAFGRVLARDKRDPEVLAKCFGPVLYAIRDQFGVSAASEMRIQAQPGVESERFVADYLGGMAKRAGEWAADSADQTSEQELQRAIRAVRTSVYREIATEKAKEPAIVQ
jgi:HK97 family phage portal protein